MKNTKQGKNQNMIEHGLSVWNTAKKIIAGDFDTTKVPDWFAGNHHWIVNNLEDWGTIQAYMLWHDCGKPFCQEFDGDGKQHFPNHAGASEKIFNETFPDNTLIGRLIGLDMIFHTKKYEEIIEMDLGIKTLATLLLSAFAEINANAEIFGGTDSTSFKIKYKKLDKLGKKLIEHFNGHVEKHMYVFVRKDIPDNHKVVQAGHAIFELAKNKTPHPSFVVLGVDTEGDFRYIIPYLVDNGIQFKLFREPMEPYNGAITAIATEPLDNRKRILLRGFRLLNISLTG